MSKDYEVPDLSDIPPALGIKMMEKLVKGDLQTQLLTAQMSKAGLNAFMMRKIEHHIGEYDEANYLSKVEEAKPAVVGALAHETDHIDAINAAYEKLIEMLELYIECFNTNVELSAQNN